MSGLFKPDAISGRAPQSATERLSLSERLRASQSVSASQSATERLSLSEVIKWSEFCAFFLKTRML
jgi:hypothetical protein